MGGELDSPEARSLICDVVNASAELYKEARRGTCRLRSRVDCREDSKDEKSSVGDLLSASDGAGLVVEQGGWERNGESAKRRIPTSSERTVAEAQRHAEPTLVSLGEEATGRRTYHATEPMRLTNLSRSLAPAHAIPLHATTTAMRKRFFSHLTLFECLPDREKTPFSIIRTAGKSCSGVERRMAIE